MASVGKSILNTGKKFLSKKATIKAAEKKTIRISKLPIKFIQPHMPIEKGKLTKALKKEIEKEFDLLRPEIQAAAPESFFAEIDVSLESFFHNRDFTLDNFNLLLQVMSQKGKIDESLGLIEKMKLMGIMPNLRSYIHLITASGRAKDPETSELIFSNAKRDLEDVPAVLYSALISSYVISGNHDKILNLINEKKDKGFSENVVDYTCYMNSLIKSGNAEQAIQISEKIEPYVDVDEYMLAMTIHACTKTNNAEYALRV